MFTGRDFRKCEELYDKYYSGRKFHDFRYGVPETDVFPMLDRANTLRKAMVQAGLVERELDTINHYPAYLMFSPALFRVGVIYERLTSLRLLRSLRGSILCVFEKEGDPERSMAALELITSNARFS